MDNLIEKRIRRLEWKNRILIALFVSLIVVFSVIASKNPGADIIKCQELHIVDAEGNTITMLGVDKDGSRGLFLYDDSGLVRLAAIHDSTQTALYMLDSTETIRVGAAQYAHGGGGFALHGEHSKGSTVLYHKGKGSLTFYGEGGVVLEKVAPDTLQ